MAQRCSRNLPRAPDSSLSPAAVNVATTFSLSAVRAALVESRIAVSKWRRTLRLVGAAAATGATSSPHVSVLVVLQLSSPLLVSGCLVVLAPAVYTLYDVFCKNEEADAKQFEGPHLDKSLDKSIEREIVQSNLSPMQKNFRQQH